MPKKFVSLGKKHILTEVGKGKRGSIFVKGEAEIHARKIGRTVGGLQIWEIDYRKDFYSPVERKIVYLKNRKELKKVVDELMDKAV